MSSLADINSHVRDVLNTVHNQSPVRHTSDSVAQSWTRCLTEFRLDPGHFVRPDMFWDRSVRYGFLSTADISATPA